ncbi:NAD(P)/FAD-dependent oxidoreductase [Sediminibacterium goheungense]|uniref:Glycine/D-amino acid oxidase-like deaminating enzyme n=1 Tax=Sediminibacterium goheungense TaxID=1086393 RepID=A0A4R6IXS6_9BACT|nr:FAD-dependent oxidoreductase [Sediminibacterium goheungense]TDO27227.1 glycine/D-amino acid oxidase-like deaminating enzyme [Sediminibacterium goheungense]
MTIDYLIIGQGICGTMLSWNLMRAGKTVLVLDEAKPYTASKVASGVINPVTGRRIVRTWEIDTIMPFAVNEYRSLEKELGVSLIRQSNILDFHPTPQMMLAFKDRLPEEKEYLRVPENTAALSEYFHFDFGVGEINPCWLIDLHTLIDNWRKVLQENHALLEQKFEWKDCSVSDNGVNYAGIHASAIICCEGAAGFHNPYFQLLPYAPNKGQAIIAEIKDLPATNIYKQGINLVPWKKDLWWIGSTYEWDFTDLNPSPDFRKKVETQLAHWLKLPFTIVDHIAAERPANMERRPFAGMHPVHSSIGLLNGMGTKGCSLAPFFAKQFATSLIHKEPIMPAADVQRFSRILSR